MDMIFFPHLLTTFSNLLTLCGYIISTLTAFSPGKMPNTANIADISSWIHHSHLKIAQEDSIEREIGQERWKMT